MRCGRTFRLARTHPAHARSSGSETSSRSRSLAGYTIDTHESEFSEATQARDVRFRRCAHAPAPRCWQLAVRVFLRELFRLALGSVSALDASGERAIKRWRRDIGMATALANPNSFGHSHRRGSLLAFRLIGKIKNRGSGGNAAGYRSTENHSHQDQCPHLCAPRPAGM